MVKEHIKKDIKTTSRADSTRSKTERPKTWIPPSSLDTPRAPDGFRYRWIRAESVGFEDIKNIQECVWMFFYVTSPTIWTCMGLGIG